MAHFAALSYLIDSGILSGNFVRSGSLSTNQCRHALPSNKPGPHTGRSHRSCLDIRQLINMVEFLSIYSKDYLQSYHTHIPVSSYY